MINLQIDFDGTLLWNNLPVDRATLQSYISTEAQKSPQPEVHIGVDKFANYEVVAQTLADLQRRGLNKIGFVERRILLARKPARRRSRCGAQLIPDVREAFVCRILWSPTATDQRD